MLAMLFFALVTVVPVRIGTQLYDTNNKQLHFCLIAVISGFILTAASTAIIGGLGGLLVSYALVSWVYSKIFGLAFSSALIFTLVIFIIQIGITQFIGDVGTVLFSNAI